MPEYIPQHLLVTGGAGFIGSAYVRLALASSPERRVTVLDALTYAGNLENLAEVQGDPRMTFVHGDITDPSAVEQCLHGVDAVVNFAAESHVDRSIHDAVSFVQTNVLGVQVLLATSLAAGVQRFVQVSTDEVYGDIATGFSREEDQLAPRSPYSATKAGGELLARSYFTTHGLPVLITRGSNTFGPRQHPEKFMPLFISNALENRPVPLYGDGLQVRDWLFVDDHCSAIDQVLRFGAPGEAYNVGGGNPLPNAETAARILALCGRGRELIQYVADRKGHDRRYAIDCEKIYALGWRPARSFEETLVETVAWYRTHQDWWRATRESAEFATHYVRTYQSTRQ